MPSRFALTAFLALVVALPLGAAVPAAAQGPAQSYLFGEKRFRNTCRPPLKYAAGACVRRCPAGYDSLGGYCRFRSMRR
ncbi:hypothetical protein [Methylobacterium haplocladii]|uniref:Uncharacterized protein n=1 Tax=Methylobacterium haplocladii TaxID=1176176 RepID=A0A512ILQ9_9HYPH|nr:hypothetical protein [Methylobacterium haplocladii]GEO98572.1 hypothetical protein MHA02_09600 [Methylobacterium haplocladii]GJD82202.1 hypothetical protein HPGCJGGD_0053 [Methylobacterium haplocladii]GLS59214.1 hypothetical protein GCM10007887_18800 [Methylobacterium haplocladii]